MKIFNLTILFLIFAASCSAFSQSAEERAIQAAKNMFIEAARESANPEEDIKVIEKINGVAFPAQKGWAVVLAVHTDVKIVQLDELGKPLNEEWAKLTTPPLSHPIADKHEAVRRAQHLWSEAGNKNKIPCYAVSIVGGWLAIFGDYMHAMTVFVDNNGKVYDTKWIE